MKWSDLTAGQRKGILIGWPLVVVAGFGYLLYGSLGKLGDDPALKSVSFIPREKNSKNLWDRIKKLEKQVAAERAYAKRLPEVEQDLEEIKQRIGELRARLPSQKQKEMMRLQLQEMVNEVPESVGKLEFVSVSIQEQGGSGGRRGRREAFTTVNYRLSLMSDMNGAIWYINRIETSPRFMSVNNITITPGRVRLNTDTREIERDLHRLNIDVVTYVLNEEG